MVLDEKNRLDKHFFFLRHLVVTIFLITRTVSTYNMSCDHLKSESDQKNTDFSSLWHMFCVRVWEKKSKHILFTKEKKLFK